MLRSLTKGARQCRRKFLRIFPKGFRDNTYLDWERGYKALAHRQWTEHLDQEKFGALIARKAFREIALLAVRIEARTNLLFSFEKMALRDALAAPRGARAFALGLYDFIYGNGTAEERFERWVSTVAALPRKQTRVLTWPIVTVFGFVAQPKQHVFLKPNVTRAAAREYGYDFYYRSAPSWTGYRSLLDFAALIRRDLIDLRPRDMIDVQSFIWVQGSDEYAK
jgi:hypothetical protein